MDNHDDRSADAAREAFANWVREQHQAMGQYAFRQGLIPEESEGAPVWSMPHRLFIGKVWPKADPKAAHWIISGELPTDHIDGDLAETARDAARHFALKWQLQSARIEQPAEDDPTGDRLVDWAQVADSLKSRAEALYAIVENDDLWNV